MNFVYSVIIDNFNPALCFNASNDKTNFYKVNFNHSVSRRTSECLREQLVALNTCYGPHSLLFVKEVI